MSPSVATGETPKVASSLELYVRTNAASISLDYERRVKDPERQSHARKVLEDVAGGHWRAQYVDQLQEILYFAGRQREGSSLGIQFPLYDVKESLSFNSKFPSVTSPDLQPVVPGRRWSLFGQVIGFPIGVPASAITGSAEGIALLARSGYNVLTFKTVRSVPYDEHYKLPNWVFLPDTDSPLAVSSTSSLDVHVVGNEDAWVEPWRTKFSTANSFGVPSPPPEVWQSQVELSLKLLDIDQILIVSVMGTTPSNDADELASDYVRVSQMAEDTGARAVELNLSCPNTLDPASAGMLKPICLDVSLTTKIVRAVREALKPETRLAIKLSFMDLSALNDVIRSVGTSIDAVSGINSLQAHIVNAGGDTLFPGRPMAGLSGTAIALHAIQFVEHLVHLRSELNADFEILGMGGVTDAESFSRLYEAGSTAVQSASGVVINQDLARQCMETVGSSLSELPHVPTDALEAVQFATRAYCVVKRGNSP